MNLIELHILQSFPVTCLNRDDVGAPKSATFGGVPRARVSSQCWKRAIRQFAHEQKPQLFAGQRGHFIAEPLMNDLVERGLPEAEAKAAAEAIVEQIAKRDSKYKNGHKTSVAVFISPLERAAIADAVVNESKSGKKLEVKRGVVKKAIEAAHPRDMADIALFGRMVADDHSLTLEGAAMFSHALSTHRVSNELDFFSAVDEIKPEQSAGAGHIGTLEFNSACYYRYVAVNLDLLDDPDHLGHLSDDERLAVLETFIRATILAVPNARHNSMLGHNPAAFVLGSRRTGQPISLANAFESPATGREGYLSPSISRLKDHHDNLDRIYSLGGKRATLDTTANGQSLTLDAFCKELLNDA